MVITSIQLNNIAQTVYNLMTGTYDLKYFYSPYNDLIINELTDAGGKAFNTFTKIYNSVYSLDQSGNLQTDQKETYGIIEDFMDDLDHTQDLLCICAFKRGYYDENDQNRNNTFTPVYENHLKRELHMPGGIGNYNYSRLIASLNSIRKLSYDTNTSLPSDIMEIIDIQFSILTSASYLYGQQLAKGNLPVWSNPELSYLNGKRAKSKASFTKNMLMKIYNKEIELEHIKTPHCDSCSIDRQDFSSCSQNTLTNLPEQYHQDFTKMCQLHNLTDTAIFENIYIQGMRTGIALAVEALIEE